MKTMSAHRILLTLNFGPVAQHLFTAKTVKGRSLGSDHRGHHVAMERTTHLKKCR